MTSPAVPPYVTPPCPVAWSIRGNLYRATKIDSFPLRQTFRQQLSDHMVICALCQARMVELNQIAERIPE